MEENTGTASHQSPVSSGEVARVVITESAAASGGGSTAADSDTTMNRKREDEHSDRVDTESSPASPPLALVSSSLSVNSSAKAKRRRGRPKGSGKLQILASLGGCLAETAGGNFSPYVLTVKTGEDIAGKVISFLKRLPQAALCILSAVGMVSRVVIRQPDSPGVLLTFEGCFEILSLSGSLRYSKTGRTNRVAGMLSISLAKPDGEVFGGVVGGPLVADDPIQLIVATFKQNIIREFKKRKTSESSTAASRLGESDTVRVPIARMTEDIGNCATPTNAPLILTHEGAADAVMAENQNLSLAPPHNVNAVLWHPITISDRRMYDKNSKGQNLSHAASVPTVDDALQVLKHKSDEGASPTSVTAKNPSPASPPSIDGDALQVLQPNSEQEGFSDMAIAESKKSDQPFLNSTAPSN